MTRTYSHEEYQQLIDTYSALAHSIEGRPAIDKKDEKLELTDIYIHDRTKELVVETAGAEDEALSSLQVLDRLSNLSFLGGFNPETRHRNIKKGAEIGRILIADMITPNQPLPRSRRRRLLKLNDHILQAMMLEIPPMKHTLDIIALEKILAPESTINRRLG